jgi:hypothetical protein
LASSIKKRLVFPKMTRSREKGLVFPKMSRFPWVPALERPTHGPAAAGAHRERSPAYFTRARSGSAKRFQWIDMSKSNGGRGGGLIRTCVH